MEITTNTTITINVNGVNYSFPSPHPIMDLIDQLNNETQMLDLWNSRAISSTAKITDLNAQIQALCVTPT